MEEVKPSPLSRRQALEDSLSKLQVDVSRLSSKLGSVRELASSSLIKRIDGGVSVGFSSPNRLNSSAGSYSSYSIAPSLPPPPPSYPSYQPNLLSPPHSSHALQSQKTPTDQLTFDLKDQLTTSMSKIQALTLANASLKERLLELSKFEELYVNCKRNNDGLKYNLECSERIRVGQCDLIELLQNGDVDDSEEDSYLGDVMAMSVMPSGKKRIEESFVSQTLPAPVYTSMAMSPLPPPGQLIPRRKKSNTSLAHSPSPSHVDLPQNLHQYEDECEDDDDDKEERRYTIYAPPTAKHDKKAGSGYKRDTRSSSSNQRSIIPPKSANKMKINNSVTSVTNTKNKLLNNANPYQSPAQTTHYKSSNIVSSGYGQSPSSNTIVTKRQINATTGSSSQLLVKRGVETQGSVSKARVFR